MDVYFDARDITILNSIRGIGTGPGSWRFIWRSIPGCHLRIETETR